MSRTLFQPGQSGNPHGRPKGVPNKVTKSVRDAFKEAFDVLQTKPGVKLADWAEKNPKEFYQLSSKLIPMQVEAEVRDVTLTDAQRAARLAALLNKAPPEEDEPEDGSDLA